MSGCAAIEKQTSGTSPAMPTPATEATEATQAGVLNAAADDLTGVSINTALPAGIVIVLLLNIYLSHRREMTRIRRNGYGHMEASQDPSPTHQGRGGGPT